MRFTAAITTATEPTQAVQELVDPVGARMTPGMVDLAFLFLTAHYEEDLDDILEELSAAMPHALILGCTGEGVIGVDREFEGRPSMSMIAATLPDITVRPFHITQQNFERLDSNEAWERQTGVSSESQPVFFALGDPFQFDVATFVEQLNEVYPGAPLLGGLASAGRKPEENRLLLAGDTYREGLVGVSLCGEALTVKSVVSQGCRPIGKPFVITKGDRNVIYEMGGQPALAQLHSVLVDLSEEDEKLARQSLFVGRVIDEFKDQFARGDFLIHNILGVDRERGALAIAGLAKVGVTVQFHVRDAKSADEDLRRLLSRHDGRQIAGALLFGCNGRGTRMWPEPGHDIGVMRELLGNVPIAGFFCGGEFGPVGGRNFVHGFTASIALFYGDDDESQF